MTMTTTNQKGNNFNLRCPNCRQPIYELTFDDSYGLKREDYPDNAALIYPNGGQSTTSGSFSSFTVRCPHCKVDFEFMSNAGEITYVSDGEMTLTNTPASYQFGFSVPKNVYDELDKIETWIDEDYKDASTKVKGMLYFGALNHMSIQGDINESLVYYFFGKFMYKQMSLV